MIIPTFAMWLLLFFFVFEVVLNCIAEVTHFADREFYVDWWNRYDFFVFMVLLVLYRTLYSVVKLVIKLV